MEFPTLGRSTLPAISGGGIRWTLGPWNIGGVTLSDYTGLEIDLGNTVTTRGVQSDIYDAYVEVSTTAPRITLTGIDRYDSGLVTLHYRVEHER